MVAWWTRRHPRGAARGPYARRADEPPLRHDPVHRVRGDVLRRVVLGLFRRQRFIRMIRPLNILRTAVRLAGRMAAERASRRSIPGTFPLFNTLLLLTSGTTVTWAHHALLNIRIARRSPRTALILTIVLGVLFSVRPGLWEYMPHAPFRVQRLDRSARHFFMSTGFHGFHVIIGTIFLIVCLARVAIWPVHTDPSASRLRIRGLVLAFRRRCLALPVRLHLCLGFVGNGDRGGEGRNRLEIRVIRHFPRAA